MKPWQHFKTITRHRLIVMAGCFKVGLYWQGLTHDLSKYSPTEFWVGAKYYQGVRSPNAAEREDKGYSEAWMHHKGRNRHHYEYWTDMNMESRRYESVPMPRKYLVEQIMDRRAACVVYQGDAYTSGSALKYFMRSRERELLGATWLMGGVGAYVGMQLFRHKTKHTAFVISAPVAAVLQLLLMAFATLKLTGIL